jgi:hypothetical protein
MVEPAEKTERSALDHIGRNITIVGSIVAAIVGMNSALTTCSNETVARHQAFRQAVEAEELFWRGLYADYLATFGKSIEAEEREARLYALRALAEREVPPFDEYTLGYFGSGDSKTLARDRLVTMKGRLQEALSRKESSTPAVAAKQQDQTFVSAVQEVRTLADRKAAEESPPPPIVKDTVPDSGVSYQTRTLAVGEADGWDIDVFWCGGGGTGAESSNYGAGLAAARRLADWSKAGQVLGGAKLGRVRLIMLPEQRQGSNYPARGWGSEIRSDRIEEERQLAERVRSSVPGGQSFRLILNDPPPSRWYLSLFSCASGERPAGRPPPASVVPRKS